MRQLLVFWGAALLCANAKDLELKRVLVTGGSGFLGRNIVRALVKQGVEVTALATDMGSKVALAQLGAYTELGDLREPALAEQAVAKLVAGCDLVIHAAEVNRHGAPLPEAKAVNVEGVHLVLAAAAAAAVPRVVYVGAPAALAPVDPGSRNFGNSTLPSLPFRSSYSTTKNLGERAALSHKEKLQVVVVRPGLLWGRDDTSFLPLLKKAAGWGRWGWLGDSQHLVSTCHVANAVHGVLRAAVAGQAGETYPLTDGPAVNFATFANQNLVAVGAAPLTGRLPLSVSWPLAAVVEGFCSMTRLCEPFLTRQTLVLMTQEMTMVDTKAREEIAYTPAVSVNLGIASLPRAFFHHDPNEETAAEARASAHASRAQNVEL